MGVPYVCKMMQAMYRSQDVIPHFVDMGAISDFDGGMNCQQIEIHDAVVHSDSICGKVFRCPDPGQTDKQTWSN